MPSAPWWLVGILLLGFGLRWYVSVRAYASTFDTSTPGLMGLHILQGARPLFYYGQSYMGALEAYGCALMFALFGPTLTAMTLAPILFTVLWMLASYALFQELYGPRAGLAAAAVVAVPGWDMLWYSLASYGGYPTAFFFGTVALWLVVRLVARPLSPRVQWLHVLCLGAVAGLGLWTHYLSAVYLLTGALFLGAWWFRSGCPRRVVVPFAVGGVLFLIGCLPSFFAYNQYGGGNVIHFQPTSDTIQRNWRIFTGRVVERLLFWPLSLPGWLKVAVVVVLIVAAVCFLVAVRALWRRDGWRVWVPIVFSAVFLFIYLSHTMAHTGAPRYVMPLVAMALAAVFGGALSAGRYRWRVLSGVLLVLWLSYNGAAAVVMAQKKAPSKKAEMARRNRLVQHAREAGARTVKLVGGPIFGHEGQALTFYAGDEIQFVSVFDERYQPAAQSAECDPRAALACEAAVVPKLDAALGELDVRHARELDQWVSLFSDLEVPRRKRRALSPAEWETVLDDGVQGDASFLTDRVYETFVEASIASPAGFTVDLGKEVRLDSLWLFAPGYYQFGLPAGYTLSVSLDGETFRPVREVPLTIPVAYTYGDQVYLKGYFGKMECRFERVPARYLRLVCTQGQGPLRTWQLSELYIFESAGSVAEGEEAEAVLEVLEREPPDFVVADRWLSAKYLERRAWSKANPPAYPRFNPKYRFTRLSRQIVPRAGMAIVALAAVAEDCAAVLRDVYGEKAIAGIEPAGAYTVLRLGKGRSAVAPDARVFWNGHVLVKSFEPEGNWF